MKMTKKFLLGAAVALAAVMFSSCMQTVGVGDKIKVNENMDGDLGCLATAKIDYLNELDSEWARGMRFLRTKHDGMTVKMVLQNQTTSGDLTGVVGLVWDKTENEDGSINFMVMGMRNRQGVIEYYISYYANILKEELGYYNFGAAEALDPSAGLSKADLMPKWGKEDSNAKCVTKTAFDPSCTTPYEIVVVDWTTLGISIGDDNTIADMKDEEKNAAVAMAAKIVAEDDATYTVKLYKGSDMPKYKINEDAVTIGTVTIPNTKTGVDTTAEGYEAKKIEEKLGFYVNVYPTQRMAAQWFLGDLEGNPIVADWDDTQVELNPIFK